MFRLNDAFCQIPTTRRKEKESVGLGWQPLVAVKRIGKNGILHSRGLYVVSAEAQLNEKRETSSTTEPTFPKGRIFLPKWSCV